MATSIIADLAKIAFRRFVFGPLASALGGVLGGIGGGIGGGSISAGVYHSGGRVPGPASMMIPAAALAAAPRFHNGGGMGLGSDEYAAVLLRGERVLNRAENPRLGRRGGHHRHIYARDAESFRASRAQVASDIARAVAMAEGAAEWRFTRSDFRTHQPRRKGRAGTTHPDRRTGLGDEERNASWANSRRRYDVSYGVRRADDLAAVVAFFEARNGRLHAFRFKDWSDYKSCLPSAAPAAHPTRSSAPERIGHHIALTKTYASGAQSWARAIIKPVAGTVTNSLNGVALGSGWSVNTATGIVTFAVAPTTGA